MTLQPHLFQKIRDELGDEPLEITNGYRTYDFRNRNEWEEWKQAYDRILVQKLDEAHRLLANYPQHAIAYWAHEEIISKYDADVSDFDTEIQTTDDLRKISEHLLSAVTAFLKYKAVIGKPKNTERFPGYFDFVSYKAEETLIFTIQALEYVGQTEQLNYLSISEELFPESAELQDLRQTIEAVDLPFELSFTDLHSGSPIDIRAYRGEVVLIDFWATWCQPCLDYIPFLKNLLDREQHRGLKIVGISCDMAGTNADNDNESSEPEKELESLVLKCAVVHGIDSPLFIDHEFHKKWSVKSIPTIFAIDRRGILRSTNARQTLRQTVEELLNE